MNAETKTAALQSASKTNPSDHETKAAGQYQPILWNGCSVCSVAVAGFVQAAPTVPGHSVGPKPPSRPLVRRRYSEGSCFHKLQQVEGGRWAYTLSELPRVKKHESTVHQDYIRRMTLCRKRPPVAMIHASEPSSRSNWGSSSQASRGRAVQNL